MTQAGIAPPSLSAWRALAQAALKGAPFEALITNSPSGLAIAPLYTQADAQIEPPLSGARIGPWDARQIVSSTDPAQANLEALRDLEGGASSIEIEVQARDGGRGVRLDRQEDLAALTAGWMIDLAPMALSADAPQASDLLLAFAKARGLLDTAFAFNRDPLGAALRGALQADALPDALREAIAFDEAVAADFPRARALRLDARAVHEAGASEAQEIGFLAGALALYLRAGLAPARAADACLVSLALSADPLVEIAKLRAARLILGRVLELCAVPTPRRVFALQALVGKRMLTRRDPWVNLLRAAAAGFAGAVGGADVLTILPLSEALGQPDAFARRLARNAHAILAHEAHLAHVMDPAAGAYAFEALTEDIAAAGWAFFQQLEGQGGVAAALASGWLAAAIAPVRAEREARVRRRQDALTGVSQYPLLGERSIEAHPWPAEPARNPLLEPMRLAAPFERLRDLADAAGNPPVFLANLGSLAEFAPRAQFTANLLAAGGLTVLGAEQAYQDDAALADAFRASGARAACLCSTDSAYAAQAESTARALIAAGCGLVALAGRPAEHEATWRAAGIAVFIYAGGDAIEALEAMHAGLGVRA
jgi:methylmalonyl-CoA mutase